MILHVDLENEEIEENLVYNLKQISRSLSENMNKTRGLGYASPGNGLSIV